MVKYKLIHGNCLDIMPRLKEQSIDLIVTDPPYTRTKRGKSCRPNWMPDNMGDSVFEGQIPDAETWVGECFRILKPDTHFYTFTNTNDIQQYLNSATSVGFKLHNIISMIKDTLMPNRWYCKQTELILFFRKGNAKPINDYASRDNVQVVMPKQSSGKLHITQKPLNYIAKLVTNSSQPNEIVFDPFMGSGTTGVAATENDRRFIGVEQNVKYCNVAEYRIRQKRPRKLFS